MAGRKRGNGEGSIYFAQATRRWRGAVTLPDGSRRCVSGATQKSCRDQLRAIIADAERGGAPGAGLTGRGHGGAEALRVETFLDDWLTNIAPARARVRSSNTVDGYRWAIEKHLTPAVGGLALAALTPEDVERLLRSMAGRGLARNTIVRVRATLVLALTHAERRSMVNRNVARLAELPVGAKPAPEGRSLTVDEAHILLDAARRDPLEALWVTGLMLGLRPGELTGLLWIDVDLDAATLQVRRLLKNESTGLRLGEPKTRRSYRDLDLPPQVVDALDRHRGRQRAQRQLAGPAWIEHELVFTTSVGTALDPANLRRSFSALTRQAGLGHWTPKELRHSATSFLSAAGVPLELIADVLGHDGTRMTGSVYRHAVRPTVAAGAEAMPSMEAPDEATCTAPVGSGGPEAEPKPRETGRARASVVRHDQ